jgi:hypothetical protein
MYKVYAFIKNTYALELIATAKDQFTATAALRTHNRGYVVDPEGLLVAWRGLPDHDNTK